MNNSRADAPLFRYWSNRTPRHRQALSPSVSPGEKKKKKNHGKTNSASNITTTAVNKALQRFIFRSFDIFDEVGIELPLAKPDPQNPRCNGIDV